MWFSDWSLATFRIESTRMRLSSIVILVSSCFKVSALKCVSSSETGNAFYSELVGKQLINVCSERTQFCKKIYMWNASGHSIERDCDGGRACRRAGCELNMTAAFELCCCDSAACNGSSPHTLSFLVMLAMILCITFTGNSNSANCATIMSLF